MPTWLPAAQQKKLSRKSLLNDLLGWMDYKPAFFSKRKTERVLFCYKANN